ncbi:hypothetical protein OENI_70031 [Oenococcus oeni]|nr:hypothetical protein OENI_70031 [Oenococcus oeni]SYW17823.1 hypothetical protein OENI_130012 [Oenococcus oeni]
MYLSFLTSHESIIIESFIKHKQSATEEIKLRKMFGAAIFSIENKPRVAT